MSDDNSLTAAPAKSKFRVTRRGLLVTLVVCGGVAALLAAPIRLAREAGRMAKCACRMTQIGLALQNYEGDYGVYPPAYQQLDGQPSSSWRLELLPYMGLQAEYNRYRRNERWDSPFNLRLADDVAAGSPMYRCASAPASQGPSLTNFVMPVGPQTISPGASGVKRAAIRDGTSFTIAVAEIAPTDIYWTEPRDLNMKAMSFQINARSQPSISSEHPGRVLVLFADGHTQWLSDSIDPKMLKSWLTIDGNENIPPPSP